SAAADASRPRKVALAMRRSAPHGNCRGAIRHTKAGEAPRDDRVLPPGWPAGCDGPRASLRARNVRWPFASGLRSGSPCPMFPQPAPTKKAATPWGGREIQQEQLFLEVVLDH